MRDSKTRVDVLRVEGKAGPLYIVAFTTPRTRRHGEIFNPRFFLTTEAEARVMLSGEDDLIIAGLPVRTLGLQAWQASHE